MLSHWWVAALRRWWPQLECCCGRSQSCCSWKLLANCILPAEGRSKQCIFMPATPAAPLLLMLLSSKSSDHGLLQVSNSPPFGQSLISQLSTLSRLIFLRDHFYPTSLLRKNIQCLFLTKLSPDSLAWYSRLTQDWPQTTILFLPNFVSSLVIPCGAYLWSPQNFIYICIFLVAHIILSIPFDTPFSLLSAYQNPAHLSRPSLHSLSNRKQCLTLPWKQFNMSPTYSYSSLFYYLCFNVSMSLSTYTVISFGIRGA